MKKRNQWFFGVILTLLPMPAEALCEGYGFYGWGRGWPSIGAPGQVEDLLPEFKDLEIDLQNDHFSFGYLYDGASTPEDRFGWRVNFGLDVAVTSFEGTNTSSGLVSGSTTSLRKSTTRSDSGSSSRVPTESGLSEMRGSGCGRGRPYASTQTTSIRNRLRSRKSRLQSKWTQRGHPVGGWRDRGAGFDTT